MLKEQLAVAELLRNLIRGNTEHISRVTFTPQKTAFQEEAAGRPLPRKTPESQGLSSWYLARLIEELAADERTDLHHVIVLRHGAVVAQADVAPYRRGMWHASYSMCKTVTGMAVGMLIDEGRLSLEDRIVPLLDRKLLFTGIRQKSLTVEHLLTMTSGVGFNETGIVSGDDWVAGYLQSPVKGTPGTSFSYNSMNSYILSAVVTKVTGESMMEYLRPRLWEPLGIRQVFWESCPKGINKGGWGLFISTEDAAKLGQLYLQKGSWEGRQLISEDWVEAATRKHIDTPEEMGPYGYGYQVWMGGRPGSCTFNGMLGQNVIVYPDLDMVIAANAGSDELFQNCVLLNIVKKYFEGDFTAGEALPEDPAGRRQLADVTERLAREGRRFSGTGSGCRAVRRKESRLGLAAGSAAGRWNRGKRPGTGSRLLEEENWKRILDGGVYELEQTYVGLCPLVFQVFHNNYTDGIRAVGFYCENKKFYMTLEEGETLHRLEIGFGKAAVTEAWFHEEPYLLAVQGIFTKDEDGFPVLKLDIALIEEAVRRKVKCCFRNRFEEIEMRWDETPGSRMISEGLGSLLGDSLKSGIADTIQNMVGVDLPALLVDRTIHPVVTGRRRSSLPGGKET